jgi:hypothetical protein
VAAQEAQLQLLDELRGDRPVDEAAEPRVHAVGLLGSRGCALDDRTGGLHFGAS